MRGRLPKSATIKNSADSPLRIAAPPPKRAKVSLGLAFRSSWCIPHHPKRAVIFPHPGFGDKPRCLAGLRNVCDGLTVVAGQVGGFYRKNLTCSTDSSEEVHYVSSIPDRSIR